MKTVNLEQHSHWAQILSSLHVLALGIAAIVTVSTSIGWMLGLIIAFLSIVNEVIDLCVVNTPKTNASQLPDGYRRFFLKHPGLFFASSLFLIVSATAVNAWRFFIFYRNFFVGMVKHGFQLSAFRGLALGLTTLGSMMAAASAFLYISINFRKMWQYEIKAHREPLLPTSQQKHPVKQPGFWQNTLQWFKRQILQNTKTFDVLVGMTMFLGAVLYFTADWNNMLSQLTLAAMPMSQSLYTMAFAYAGLAWLNQMILWSCNNQAVYLQAVPHNARETVRQRFTFIRLLHFPPSIRRIVFYLRELSFCLFDFFSLSLMLPGAPLLGLPRLFWAGLGAIGLSSNMFCRFVVLYFQSKKLDLVDDPQCFSAPVRELERLVNHALGSQDVRVSEESIELEPLVKAL